MTAREAKEIAREWVSLHAAQQPGFAGAFFHGSAVDLGDDTLFPATSDLDVMLVFAEPPPVKLGKFLYKNVLLEISHLGVQQVRSAESILGQYHLAGSFRTPGIIADPSGQLALVQEGVAAAFAKRRWVEARCRHAMEHSRRHLQRLVEGDPFHDQVTAWLFGTGVTTHVLLVAGLRNPTVRKRYFEVKRLLAECARMDFYEELIELLGCAQISVSRAEHHLQAVAEVFDAASEVVKTPFPFSSDLGTVARGIAIDGSRELIRSGHHREAVFWLAATYARCSKVLHHDAEEELQSRFDAGFRALMADLRVASFEDLRRRRGEVEAFLPRVWDVCEEIMQANPQIQG